VQTRTLKGRIFSKKKEIKKETEENNSLFGRFHQMKPKEDTRITGV